MTACAVTALAFFGGILPTLAADKTGTCSYKCDNGNGFTSPDKCGDDFDCAALCAKECGLAGHGCGSEKDIVCTLPPQSGQTTPGVTAPPKTPAKVGKYGLRDPLAGATIPEILGNVIKFALGFVGALFLFMFVFGGFLWMTAGGESDRVKKSQQTLKNAIIGMAVVVLSYTLLVALLNLSASF